MTNRIAFLGSPDFASAMLRALVAADANVVGVVTQPDRPAGRGKQLRPPSVKVCALELGLPVVQPERIRGGVLRRWLQDNAIDLAVVAAFGRILTPPMLAAPRLGCVNVHASLLPRWRGASPIQRAIAAGDAESGVCLMQMAAGLDTGPVLARTAVPITDEDTAETLHDKLAEAGARLLAERLDELLRGRLVAEAQDDSQATWAPLLQKSEGRIDWTRPARLVHAQVRAMTPWPGATLDAGAERWKVFATAISAVPERGTPGTILAIGDAHAVVACGEGALRIGELQRPGKRRMAAASVLRGARLTTGDELHGTR